MAESPATPAEPSSEPAVPTAPVVPAAEPAGLPANDPNGEGASQTEIDAALKSSGIKLPTESVAAADDEEGEDPDKPAAPVADDKEEPAADEEPEPAAKPAKPATPPAPDASAADDKYSFQIEDLNGVTFKISADAKMEDILAEFEPKNNGQILDILEQLRIVKDQKASDEAEAAKQTAETERTEQTNKFLADWGDEAKALQGVKRIPEGTDGDTRISEVYKFMADENTKRMEAGKPTLNSFEDALDKLENKEARDKVAADAKADKEKARANGGKVGGSSAPASSGPPIYRAGSARNANQALRSMSLLE